MKTSGVATITERLTALVINAGTNKPSEVVLSNMRQAQEGFWAIRGGDDSLTAHWQGDIWIPPHRIFSVKRELVYGGGCCDL